MTRTVSTAWLLNELAGMTFSTPGGAYDFIKKRLADEPPTKAHDRPAALGETVKDVVLDIMRSNEKPLAPGAVVQLKSGGPAMTIEKLTDGDTCAWCVWSAAEGSAALSYRAGTVYERSFSLHLLHRVNAPTDPPAAPSAPSSEPDAWETCSGALEDEGSGFVTETPGGYAVAGPWFPFAAMDGETLWRRPLRKVAP